MFKQKDGRMFKFVDESYTLADAATLTLSFKAAFPISKLIGDINGDNTLNLIVKPHAGTAVPLAQDSTQVVTAANVPSRFIYSDFESEGFDVEISNASGGSVDFGLVIRGVNEHVHN